MFEVKNIDNYLHISNENLIKIKKYIDLQFNYIESQYNNNLINPKYYSDIILLLAEALPILDEKNKWIEIGYNICKGIKQDLEYYSVGSNEISMISGFGYTCFALNRFAREAKILVNFSSTINKILLQCLVNKVQSFESKEYSIATQDYDIIMGVSGALYYLLDFDFDDKERSSITSSLNYLISLGNCHKYRGNNVINFHIENRNLFYADREQYPNGSINLGISHGMMGPMITLSKAFKLGYRPDGLESAVTTIFEIYEKLKCNKENIPYWPGQISIDQFVNFENEEKNVTYHLTSSWCYGNVGISQGLLQVAENMGWKKDGIEKDLIAIIENKEKYNLFSPGLCHGYSSILAIMIVRYIHSGKKDYINGIEYVITEIVRLYENNNDYLDGNIETLKEKDHFYEGYRKDLSLLTGSSGILLSLISCLKKEIGFNTILAIN